RSADNSTPGVRLLTPARTLGSGRFRLGVGLGDRRLRLRGGQLLGRLLRRCRTWLRSALALHLADFALKDAQGATETPGGVGHPPRAEEHHEDSGDDQPVPDAQTAHVLPPKTVIAPMLPDYDMGERAISARLPGVQRAAPRSCSSKSRPVQARRSPCSAAMIN